MNPISISKFIDIMKKNLVDVGKFTLCGDVTNMKINNKHCYLSLKDSDCMINAVIWNYEDQVFTIKNGEKITVIGKPVIFPKNGSLQFQILDLDEKIQGDELEYEKNKKICLEKGYFNKKTKLPKFVQKIAIITSLDGAALQDILYVLEKEFKGYVDIYGCNVQGINCAKSIIQCFEKIKSNNYDIVLLSRGGGSLNDLMGFSDVNLMETIFNCKSFVVSAVGHEIDNMLSDFSCDYRAPTPSIGANYILQLNKLSFQIKDYTNIFKINLDVELSYYQKLLNNLNLDEILENTLLNSFESQLENLNKINEIELPNLDFFIDNTSIYTLLDNKLKNLENNLIDLKNNLSKYNIKNNLKNGFCVLLDENNNLIDNITNYEQINILTNTGTFVFVKK